VFHFKKKHNTSCLGTRKVCLPVFFGTIVSFQCLALIWVHLLLHLLLFLCWVMVRSLLAFLIWKMFHLHPFYAFYTFFFKGRHHFPAFLMSLLYPWPFKESITNDYRSKLVFYVRTTHYSMCLLGMMPIIKWIS
jgi:hypothetical protein